MSFYAVGAFALDEHRRSTPRGPVSGTHRTFPQNAVEYLSVRTMQTIMSLPRWALSATGQPPSLDDTSTVIGWFGHGFIL